MSLRRAAAIAMCFAPVLLAIASLFAPDRPLSLWALIPLEIGVLIALLDLYVMLVRPFLYERRHGSREGYKFVSGLPSIASILLTLLVISTFGCRLVAIVTLATLVVDPGSLPWVLIAAWRYGKL